MIMWYVLYSSIQRVSMTYAAINTQEGHIVCDNIYYSENDAFILVSLTPLRVYLEARR